MRKLFSYLLFVFIFTLLPLKASATTNTISNWASLYVSDAKNVYHILPDSMSSGDYTKEVTRVDFCELAFQTLESATDLKLSSGTSSFSDTNNDYILTLQKIGIIQGRSTTIFDPNDTITREEAATILGRMADYMGLTLFENQLVYHDLGSISGWAKDQVEKVSGLCIMNGMETGSFMPRGLFTREQAIATMIRTLHNVPYLNNSTQVEGDKYFKFNNYYLWIEDQSKVIFYLPMSKYEGLDWYKRDGKLIIVATTRDFKTECFDLESKNLLFPIPFPIEKVQAGDQFLISYQVHYSGSNVDSAYLLYGLYDFNGKEVLPTNYSLNYLIENGYINR